MTFPIVFVCGFMFTTVLAGYHILIHEKDKFPRVTAPLFLWMFTLATLFMILFFGAPRDLSLGLPSQWAIGPGNHQVKFAFDVPAESSVYVAVVVGETVNLYNLPRDAFENLNVNGHQLSVYDKNVKNYPSSKTVRVRKLSLQ